MALLGGRWRRLARTQTRRNPSWISRVEDAARGRSAADPRVSGLAGGTTAAERQPRSQQRAGAGGADELELPAERFDAIAEAAQAGAAGLLGAPAAVVDHLDQRLAVELPHVDADARGVGVLRRIRQRLGDDV